MLLTKPLRQQASGPSQRASIRPFASGLSEREEEAKEEEEEEGEELELEQGVVALPHQVRLLYLLY